MNKDNHLIWENYSAKSGRPAIDLRIEEQFTKDIELASSYMREQLIAEGVSEEGVLSNIGGAIGRGWNAAKTGAQDALKGFKQGADGQAAEPGQGLMDTVKQLGTNVKDGVKKAASTAGSFVGNKMVMPLLSKAWDFLQAKAPDVAQRISNAINSGDANAVAKEVSAGGGDQEKAKIEGEQLTAEESQKFFEQYLIENGIISEADMTNGQVASMNTQMSQPGQQSQQGGGIISKAMSWMKQNPNLTTAGALGLIGIAAAALGGWPLFLMAAKGAGWGALSGGGIGGAVGTAKGLMAGKDLKTAAKEDGLQGMKSGARKGAVVGGGLSTAGGFASGVGGETPVPGGAEPPVDAAAADAPGPPGEPNFDGTQDVSRGTGAEPGATPDQMGDPNYDQAADMDGDGDVDARDEALYKMQQRYDTQGINAQAAPAPAAPAPAAPAPAAPAPAAPVSDPSTVIPGVAGGVAAGASTAKGRAKGVDSTGTRRGKGGNRLEEDSERKKRQKMLDSFRPGWTNRDLS